MIKKLERIDESRCPECMGELVLYTKPDGEYLGCLNCDYTVKSNMLPFRGNGN